MEAFLGFLMLAIIIGVIVYFVNKNKQEKETAAQAEKVLAEEKKERERDEIEEKWEEKKKEFDIIGLPIVEAGTLNLTKNEICHFVGNANSCKLKQQTVGYQGGSRGVSLRIMKGVSFRVGNHRGHYIKEEITEKTEGVIYLTSKKIVFTGAKNSCVLRYNKIVNLNIADAMLQVQTEEKTYLFQIEDAFNFLVILDYLLEKEKEIGI